MTAQDAQHAAHNAVWYAVHHGQLEPQPCEIDAPHAGEVQAHHPFGYLGKMALAVWWLCRGHHRAMHKFPPSKAAQATARWRRKQMSGGQ